MSQIVLNIGVPILTFLIGIVLGFFVGFEVSKKMKSKHITKNIVTFAIFLIWAASMVIDVYRGEANTPLFLHLFMGTVLGAMNHEFGEWLLKLINKK